MKYKVFKVVEEVHYIIIEANSIVEAEESADEKINSADWTFSHPQEENISYGETKELSNDN
jgi:hypothetical protein